VFTNFPDLNFFEQSLNAPAGEPKLLWKGGGMPTDWSSDGRFILFTGGTADDTDVMALRLDREVAAIPVVKTTANENNAKFSPNHTWIAYRSYKTGRSEVFTQPFPGPGADVQVSTNGGAQPRWSHDGKELFYIGLDGKFMSTPVQISADSARATVGQAMTLFASHVGDVTSLNGQQYDVSRDGKRFLIATVTEETSPIVIIANRPTNR
jgi:hypothetical protein